MHSNRKFSIIAVDAYRLPYIPWHLTTREFFTEVFQRLDENGVLVINVGRTLTDRRLIEAFAGTMGSVFPTVHVVDVPESFNSILYATVQPSSFSNLVENFAFLRELDVDPFLLDVLARAIAQSQPTPSSSIVYTDDWAPIERLTDSIALRFLFQGSIDVLR